MTEKKPDEVLKNKFKRRAEKTMSKHTIKSPSQKRSEGLAKKLRRGG